MRAYILICFLVAIPELACAGPLETQFGSGFAEIAWGTSLANVVAKYPGGDQVLTAGIGCRIYLVRVEDPFFGISRPGSTTMFALGADSSVVAIGLDIPYAKKEQLLSTLIQAFGSYRIAKNERGNTYFGWKDDAGMMLYVTATRDPRLGVATVWIVGPPRPTAGSCSV